MPRLKNKVAIITGAARGIGRGIAERFAEEGATVYAADVRDAEPSDRDITFTKLDVTDEGQWAALTERVAAEAGGLDILVNNAGIIHPEPIDRIELAAWDRELDVNLKGVLLGMRAAVPLMRRRGGGSIVNTSSIWGIAAISGAAAYHASKAGVRNLTKNAAIAFAPDNIRANSIHPGFIGTPMTDEQDPAVSARVIERTPLGRAGRPVEIANGALFLASDEASFVTGVELPIDGGYLAQ